MYRVEEWNSVHLSDELVDVGFPVTKVAALYVVFELPLSPATGGVRQLEGPEKICCLGKPSIKRTTDETCLGDIPA